MYILYDNNQEVSKHRKLDKALQSLVKRVKNNERNNLTVKDKEYNCNVIQWID